MRETLRGRERKRESVLWLSIQASVNSNTFSISLAASVFVLHNHHNGKGMKWHS